MLRSLLEEYDKLLARLENSEWQTMEMTFELLEIEDNHFLFYKKLFIFSFSPFYCFLNLQ